jgi:hypothetical protein
MGLYPPRGKAGTYIERVLAKIQLGGPDECWPWLATINKAGAAVLSRGPTDPPGTQVVGRFLWEQNNGPVPAGMQLNICKRTRGCCNPAHCQLSPRGKHIDPAQQGRKPMTFQEKLDSLAVRLEERVSRRGPGECHEFQGFLDPDGYGKIGFGSQVIRSSVAAWMVAHQRLPRKGMHICHRCPVAPNNSCCNIAHLEEDTPRSNMKDKILQGRGGYERRNMANVPRGEDHHNSKLTNAQRKEIIARHAAHEMIKDLAAEYSVSINTISRLVRRKK